MVGPGLVVFCMLLRATDVLFRSVTLSRIAPLELITLEHFVACLVLLPVFIKSHRFPKLTPFELFCLIFVGFGASVGGILCFTAAFQFINPALVILLQKLQPVVTVFLSIVLLKEKIATRFYLWAGIAILSGYVLAFGFTFPTRYFFASDDFRGTLLALSAVLLWGSGTVFGKILLKKFESASLTRFRYYLGFLFALVLLLLTKHPLKLGIVSHPSALVNIVYMSLVPGFAALSFYYRGLQHTRASVASILELVFPVASVALAWIFLGQPLTRVQIEAAIVLLLSIIAISRLNRSERA